MNQKKYWQSSIKIVIFILSLWFINSLILSIVINERLNSLTFMYKFGFWYAQQGSIVIFIILTVAYVLMMNSLDKKHGFLEEKEKND